jgi:hypothetical protein
VHPAIEALFTIDEETGMTGALNLKGGYSSRTNSFELEIRKKMTKLTLVVLVELMLLLPLSMMKKKP